MNSLKQMGSNCIKSNNNEAKSNQIAICVVGLDNSGKSTMAKVLKGDNDINDMVPTVGYEPHQFKYCSRDLIIHDLGGGSKVRDIWKHYFSESYGFIFVIDSSNRNRLSECRSVLTSLVENEKVQRKPMLILANKQDEPNALDESEIVQFLNLEELINKYQIPCRVEMCIAKLGVGKNMDKSIKIGFDWLLKHIIVCYNELRTRVEHDVQKQKGQDKLIRREKSERVRQKRESEYNNDYYKNDDEDEKNLKNPWKPLYEFKNSKAKSDTRQYEDNRTTSRGLLTIDEEKKARNLSGTTNRFLKNKTSPYDDGYDYDTKSKSSASWAITDQTRLGIIKNPNASIAGEMLVF